MTPLPSLSPHPTRPRGTLRTMPPATPQMVAVDSHPAVGLPKVSLRQISLSYRTNSGERLTALENINLEVRRGEFLCIVGPSGCGKSTLLHLIAGLHQQSSGSVCVDGEAVHGTG